MDETTKFILKFCTILTQRIVYLESTQVQILKWLGDVAEGDAETQQKLHDMLATIESGEEQIEALLATVKAALDG